MYLQVKAELIDLAALFVAGRKDPRFYLQGVCVQPHPVAGVYVVATDGHRLAVFHDPGGSTDAAEAIIPAGMDLRKSCRSKQKDPERVLVVQSEGGENPLLVSAAVFDLEWTEPDPGEESQRVPGSLRHAETLSLIDGRYPEWARAIPSDVGHASHPAVNPAYLEDFCKVAKSVRGAPMIRVYAAGDENGPVLVRTLRDDFVGVLMPMRWDDEEILPYWLGTKSQTDETGDDDADQ